MKTEREKHDRLIAAAKLQQHGTKEKNEDEHVENLEGHGGQGSSRRYSGDNDERKTSGEAQRRLTKNQKRRGRRKDKKKQQQEEQEQAPSDIKLEHPPSQALSRRDNFRKS